jgi:uncharacterized protein DUF2380
MPPTYVRPENRGGARDHWLGAKVSDLILSLNIAVRAAGSGKLLAGARVDVRGTPQQSWSRALDHLLTNRLLGAGAL